MSIKDTKLKYILISIIGIIVFMYFPTIAPPIIYFVFVVFLISKSSIYGFLNILTASSISIFWSFYAKNEYLYNQNVSTFYGMSLYPIFAWASGLLIIQIIYLYVEPNFVKNSYFKKFILFSILYSFLLITVETVAYHIFNVKNVHALKYDGLPICNCLHAPHWMQMSYFLIGPLFFSITLLWNTKNNYNFKALNSKNNEKIAKESI